jgi:hypothetical protein
LGEGETNIKREKRGREGWGSGMKRERYKTKKKKGSKE